MRPLSTLSVLMLGLGLSLGCSDGGATAGDGGSDGGDGGGAETGACTGPLSAAMSFCQSNLSDQIASGTCDSDMPNTRTCGSYKVWEFLFIGSQSCVYDATGATLVAARNCDSGLTDMCPSGCFVYGLPESAYTTGCGPDTPACP